MEWSSSINGSDASCGARADAVKVKARHPARVFVTRLLGVLVVLFVLTFFIPTINRTHWRPADQDIQKAAQADSIEMWESGHSRIVSDRGAIAATLLEIKNAPGNWKRGLYKEPDGYAFFVFLKSTVGPPGNDPLLILRMTHGFLIHGSGGQWEYKYIDPKLEAQISVTGFMGKERKPKP
jgi:hypothetical protein